MIHSNDNEKLNLQKRKQIQQLIWAELRGIKNDGQTVKFKFNFDRELRKTFNSENIIK